MPADANFSESAQLPSDIVELILDELATILNPTQLRFNLYRLSRIYTSWTEPCLTRLYRNLHLVYFEPAVMESLAKSPALRRYHTRSIKAKTLKAWSGWNELLDGCAALEELELKRAQFWLQSDLLQHPLLTDLKSLTMFQDHPKPGWQVTTVPFQLQKPVIDGATAGENYVKAIIKASLDGEAGTLHYLKITVLPTDYDLSHFAPLAPFLKTLCLPPYYGNQVFSLDPKISAIVPLIQQTTSLSTLAFSVSFVDHHLKAAAYMTWILDELNSTLEDLQIDFTFGHDKDSVLCHALESSLKESSALRKLKRIKFGRTTLVALEKDEGWESLSFTLSSMGTEVVVESE